MSFTKAVDDIYNNKEKKGDVPKIRARDTPKQCTAGMAPERGHMGFLIGFLSPIGSFHSSTKWVG